MLILNLLYVAFRNFSALTSDFVVDAIVYHVLPNNFSAPLIDIFYPGGESLTNEYGTIGRCISFEPLNPDGFYVTLSQSPKYLNHCDQVHLQTEISRKEVGIDVCCADTTVFCAFKLDQNQILS